MVDAKILSLMMVLVYSACDAMLLVKKKIKLVIMPKREKVLILCSLKCFESSLPMPCCVRDLASLYAFDMLGSSLAYRGRKKCGEAWRGGGMEQYGVGVRLRRCAGYRLTVLSKLQQSPF